MIPIESTESIIGLVLSSLIIILILGYYTCKHWKKKRETRKKIDEEMNAGTSKQGMYLEPRGSHKTNPFQEKRQ